MLHHHLMSVLARPMQAAEAFRHMIRRSIVVMSQAMVSADTQLPAKWSCSGRHATLHPAQIYMARPAALQHLTFTQSYRTHVLRTAEGHGPACRCPKNRSSGRYQ